MMRIMLIVVGDMLFVVCSSSLHDNWINGFDWCRRGNIARILVSVQYSLWWAVDSCIVATRSS